MKDFLQFMQRAGKLDLWLSTAEIAEARRMHRHQVSNWITLARKRFKLPIERRGAYPHFEFKVCGIVPRGR